MKSQALLSSLAVFGLLWSTSAAAGPVTVKNDWHQIKPPPLRVM